MRTIEEIKNDLEYRLQELQEHINWGIGPVSLTDSLRHIRNLVPGLAQAQDAEIARLREHFTWKRTKPDPDDETIHIVHCVAGKPYYFPLPPLPQAQENNHE